MLTDVQKALLRGEAVAVLRVMGAVVVEVMLVLGPRAVTGALGRAVGHPTGLQAAVPPHGPVEVQTGDQRLSDVDAFGPDYWMIVIQRCKRALKANGENQLLLLQEGLAEKQQLKQEHNSFENNRSKKPFLDVVGSTAYSHDLIKYPSNAILPSTDDFINARKKIICGDFVTLVIV